MKKKLSVSKKMYILFMIVFIIYCLTVLINQQIKLNSYAKQKEYYQSELKSVEDEKREYLTLKENVNSPEYIEDIARKKLDMYLPNERVYVDMSK